MTYRIKVVSKEGGPTIYNAQEKFLCFWFNMLSFSQNSLERAQSVIDEDIKIITNRKKKVEVKYIEYPEPKPTWPGVL